MQYAMALPAELPPEIVGGPQIYDVILTKTLIEAALSVYSGQAVQKMELSGNDYFRDRAFLLKYRRPGSTSVTKLVVQSSHAKNVLPPEFCEKLTKAGYKSLNLKSRFEGGNLCLVGDVLFYGPRGQAKVKGEDYDRLIREISAEFSKIKGLKFGGVLEYSRELKRAATELERFAPTQFFCPVSPELLPYMKALDFYYHLDCFITPLPNGKVLILNMNLLDAESQRKLEEAVGGRENIIDLAYPDLYTQPSLMNLVPIVRPDGSIVILTHQLPPSVESALRRQLAKHCPGYTLLTPRMLVDEWHKIDSAFRLACNDILPFYVKVAVLEILKHNLVEFFRNRPLEERTSFLSRVDLFEQVPHCVTAVMMDAQRRIAAGQVDLTFLGQAGPHCLSIEYDPVPAPAAEPAPAVAPSEARVWPMGGSTERKADALALGID